MQLNLLKKIILIFLSIIVLGSIFCATQWNRWFYNPPEEVYSTPATPDRIILSYGQDALHTRIISWRCDSVFSQATLLLLQSSTLDTINLSTKGKLVQSRSGKSVFYRIVLNNLIENTNYNYQIKQEDDTTKWFSFSTFNTNKNLDFIVFGDIHQPLEDAQNMFSFVAQKHPQTQFWGFVGDMIERPTDAYWKRFYDCLGKIPKEKPIVACTGNHEYLKSIIKKIDPRWIHTFGNPQNGPEKQLGRTFYIDFSDLRYIVLDTDALQWPTDYISARRWLNFQLKNNPKKWTLVTMHHPVHSACKGRSNPLIRMTFNSLFKKYKVDIVLQGHDHSYARTNTKSKQADTTPVYLVLNSSEKNYQQKMTSEADKTASGERYYTHFHITSDALQMSTFRLTEERPFDQITIKKSSIK